MKGEAATRLDVCPLTSHRAGKREDKAMIKNSYLATAIAALPLAFGGVASAQTAAKKPNIVMMMGDDVGMWNLTVHGFDEFYGILYHLNAMEEPYERNSFTPPTMATTRLCATPIGNSASKPSRAICSPARRNPPTCPS
jgi:hypothetical protein